jgi:hypothetical protein
MPAKSKAQQMAAGAALSAKRGKRSRSSLKGASQQMVKPMSERELERPRDARASHFMSATKRPGRAEPRQMLFSFVGEPNGERERCMKSTLQKRKGIAVQKLKLILPLSIVLFAAGVSGMAWAQDDANGDAQQKNLPSTSTIGRTGPGAEWLQSVPPGLQSGRSVYHGPRVIRRGHRYDYYEGPPE